MRPSYYFLRTISGTGHNFQSTGHNFRKKGHNFQNLRPRFRQQNIKVEKGADRMHKNIPSCKVKRTNTQSNDLKNFKSLAIFNKMKSGRAKNDADIYKV